MATAPVFESKARNAEKIRNVSAIISVDDVLATLLWYQDKLGPAGRVRVGRAGRPRLDHRRRLDVPLLASDPDRAPHGYMTFYVNERRRALRRHQVAGRRGRATAGDDGVGDARVHDQRLQR